MAVNVTNASRSVLDAGLEDAMTNGSNGSGQYLESNPELQLFFAVILSFSAAVGVFGNILIILTVAMTKTLRTPSNTFIVNLAVADLVVTTVVDPFNVLGAFVGQTYFEENDALCQMIASLCAPACLCSMLSICAISINRYILICHYHRYERIFTWSKTGMMCFFLWFISYAMHFPNHVGWGHNDFDPTFYICTFSIATHSYAVFYITAGVYLPLVVVLFNYTSIFLRYWQVKRDLRKRRNISQKPDTSSSMIDIQQAAEQTPQVPFVHRRNRTFVSPLETSCSSELNLAQLRNYQKGFTNDDIKLAKTLFTVFIAFLVCWSPFSLLVLMKQPQSIPGWIYMIAIIMAHGNSSINSILYGLTNERFRRGYRKVLGLQNQSELKGAKKFSNLNGGLKMKVFPPVRSHAQCGKAPTLDGAHKTAGSLSDTAKGSTSSRYSEAIATKKIIEASSKMEEGKKKKNAAVESSASNQLLSPNGIIILIPESP